MTIRNFGAARDAEGVVALWNACCGAGEVLYRPVTRETFCGTIMGNASYDPAFDFVAEKDGRVIGYANGIAQKAFYAGQTHENTPGYLTILLVDAAYRRKGTGSALLETLERAFIDAGKKAVACYSTNPVNLGWLIPGTPGHDHNNAPGVDMECMGYPFLLKKGYKQIAVEVAMYLNLADYRYDPAIDGIRARLREEGIETGRYDPRLGYDFDRMCDRVGSEYWRGVLREETGKTRPRPILAATTQGHIVGFTGPVDKEKSGRGWFTGICTDPEYEKRGIATVLFNLLMTEFVREDAAFSTLFTGDDNHAQKLYKRTGFTVRRKFAMLRKDV